MRKALFWMNTLTLIPSVTSDTKQPSEKLVRRSAICVGGGLEREKWGIQWGEGGGGYSMMKTQSMTFEVCGDCFVCNYSVLKMSTWLNATFARATLPQTRLSTKTCKSAIKTVFSLSVFIKICPVYCYSVQ